MGVEAMAAIEVGCGQITWTAGGQRVDEERMLAEIAQAGYAGAPAAPYGERTARETVALYARYGLKPAPGYLGADFWKADQRAALLERARRFAAFTREVGCTELYVAPGGFDYRARSGRTRRETAGHVTAEDGLADDELRRFAATLSEVGEITLREGVRSCFHNHVGTVIETRAEIDGLLALTDPAVVFLGPDTGHLIWGGADPVQFCRDYAARVETLHVKDINPDVLRAGQGQGWDYVTFSRNGIFAELGEGCVDFPAIFAILRDAGFAGWAIAETDVTQKASALESATISRAYLRGIGL